MAKNNVFRFFANDKRMRATLVKHDCRPLAHDLTCANCRKMHTSNKIAQIVQWGFVSDMHWDVFNCPPCGLNTAHEYEVPLTEQQMVERFLRKQM